MYIYIYVCVCVCVCIEHKYVPIYIILFLSFAPDSNFSMLLWMITTTSCQNFSFSQLLFLTNIRF